VSTSVPNDSTTGGYIVDVPPPPATVEDLQSALQQAVAGLAGLPGSLVRPRWQPVPPAQPPVDVTWVSIGVTMVEADEYPYLLHVGGVTLAGATAPGYTIMQRHQTITVVTTFYGPQADALAAQVRDAFYVPQNYENLFPVGLKLRTIHDLQRAPELMNQQYVDRADLRMEFRAMIERVYPIRDLDGADFTINTDQGSETFQVREDTVVYPEG
jgi:hypothetical protein